MEQMMERMLAKMDSFQAKMDANKADMKVIKQKIDANQAKMIISQERTSQDGCLASRDEGMTKR
jgi:hypothetical protein